MLFESYVKSFLGDNKNLNVFWNSSHTILVSSISREVRSSRVFEDDFDPLNAAAATPEAPKSSSSTSKMSKSCTDEGSKASDPLKRRSMPPPKSASSADGGEQEKTIKVGREGVSEGATPMWQICCCIFDGASKKNLHNISSHLYSILFLTKSSPKQSGGNSKVVKRILLLYDRWENLYFGEVSEANLNHI